MMFYMEHGRVSMLRSTHRALERPPPWLCEVVQSVGTYRVRSEHGPQVAGRLEGWGMSHPKADALVDAQRTCGLVGQAAPLSAGDAPRRVGDAQPPCRPARWSQPKAFTPAMAIARGGRCVGRPLDRLGS
jgi:hypothetical protein